MASIRAQHAVEWHELVAIDQWAISKAFALQNEVVTAYRNYEFHKIYQEVHNFCVVEMGGYYLDIIKDRLYTTGANSLPRRSAQTAVFHVAEAMVRWLAPILSFTAEEAWGFLPGKRNESVFLEYLASIPGRSGARLGYRLAGLHRVEGRCGAAARAAADGGGNRSAARGRGRPSMPRPSRRRASGRSAMSCASC